MFQAKIIEDSISEAGVRLTTMQLTYWRAIHSEMMTHRVFSRSASSSRAIPIEKMIKQVRENPAMPIHWGKNQSGMQAREEHNALVRLPTLPGLRTKIVTNEQAWRIAANQAADIAEAMMNAGYHKQVVNRLLESFQWIHVIVTATEWQNFFELRYHEDAQPEIFELAKLMRHVMDHSQPKILKMGEWHLPYVSQKERVIYPLHILKKLSTARSARVSFANHDGSSPDIDKDCQLYERLVGSRPLHASPCEHQGTPLSNPDEWSGNFRGWFQHRKEVERLIWASK